MLTRRRVLVHGGLAGIVLADGRLGPLGLAGAAEPSLLQEDLWATASTIRARIEAPVFPVRGEVPHGQPAARSRAPAQDNAARGGVIERVAMRDITVGDVAEAIVAADFFYEEGRTGACKPVLRDVEVRNVTSRKSKYAFLIEGFDESPITNIRVIDCKFDGVQSDDVLEGVRDLVLTNVIVNGKRRDERISRRPNP